MIRTLGLDMGPNSIGWALIEEGDDREKSRIVDMGVRVFPEGVDAFDTSKETSKTEDRRIKRGMRRQTKRRARREKLLANSMVQAGLWPSDPDLQAAELNKNPYELRVRALEQQLTPFELGRVFLHLCRRRGFLSNRKTDVGDQEAQGLLAEINQNEKERLDGGFKTIGAMLAVKNSQLQHSNRIENDHVRNRHLSRRQMVDEFLAIWESQAQHNSNLFTDKLKFGALGPVHIVNPKSGVQELSIAPRLSISRRDSRRSGGSDLESFGIFGILFFQRPLYWPMSVVGQCELEPNQKRCPKADRAAERFRLLQEVNNLRYVNDGEDVGLNADQRIIVLKVLATKDKISFDDLRKKLGMNEGTRFNLEKGSRPGLKGNAVDVKVAKAIGKDWHDRDDKEKTRIIRVILNPEIDEYHKIVRLRDQFGFTVELAEKLLSVDLPTGYAGLSRRAIERLLPHLEKGLVYQSLSDPEQSAIHAAGYYRRDELQRRLFDRLPDFSRMKAADCRLGNIPNPVVKRALFELRKVVNAIIREYGRPDQVHVEMARTVQVGSEKRAEMSKRMRDRQKERERAADEIVKHGNVARREGIIRYLLWEEQCSECVYCGKPMSMEQLFGGDTDVDHILPYSRCLDDSQANKVVAHRNCNHDKGQQTPYEWLAGARPADYDRVVQHVTSLMKKGLMPYNKFKRFLQKELDLSQFIARQLVDTGYITRATVEYLQLLFDKPNCVYGLKGQLTSELRWQWGLDTILSELPDSPAWQEDQKLRQPNGEKNRADHRHHAIDAIVVAATNRSRLHKLSELYRRGGARRHGEILFEPWATFRDDVVDKVKQINVSYRVQRKVSGRLHEETNYGPTPVSDEWVVRKPVESLSANEVEKIRDETIRKLVIDRLAQHGIEIGRKKKIDPKKMKEALAGLTMPKGVPVKKVRITKPEKTIMPLHPDREGTAYVKPGNTHHLCIFEFEERGKKKREAVFVTLMEATQRLKRKEAVIQRKHPSRPDARFVMSLSSRELVYQMNDDKPDRILVFKTAASTSGQFWFSEQYDARRSTEQRVVSTSASTLSGRKITVDPLGRVRWAND